MINASKKIVTIFIYVFYTYKYSSLDYYYRIIQKENLLKNLQKKFATQNFPL